MINLESYKVSFSINVELGFNLKIPFFFCTQNFLEIDGI